MSTRSLTHVLDDSSESVLVTIYRQMDGYPSGMGADLAEILKGRTMVNGFGSNTPEKASNGAGCLAATIVQELKAEAGIGGIYLMPPGSTDHSEEYVYTVSPAKGDDHSMGQGRGEIRLKVEAGYGDAAKRLLFEGDVNDFDPAAAEAADQAVEV